MTNPVILLGTQSNGETLPVQVDATGRLVAEGLPGEAGATGPKGDKGDPGTPGLPGPPGEGVPKPYGEEDSVLTIKGGEPRWFKEHIVPLPTRVWSNYVSLSPETAYYANGQVAAYGFDGLQNTGMLVRPYGSQIIFRPEIDLGEIYSCRIMCGGNPNLPSYITLNGKGTLDETSGSGPLELARNIGDRWTSSTELVVKRAADNSDVAFVWLELNGSVFIDNANLRINEMQQQVYQLSQRVLELTSDIDLLRPL